MVTIRKTGPKYIEFPSHRYEQGGREAFLFTMDLETLDSILPTPPPESSGKIIGANRRFHMPHARGIAEYLYQNSDWVLGSIVLGLEPRSVQFLPYEDEEGNRSEIMGEFRIPVVGGINNLEVLDGQHRRMAIRLVLQKLEDEILNLTDGSASANGKTGRRMSHLEEKLASLKGMAIPVALYVEPDQQSRRRMFSDLAQTRNIDAITKTRFDDRDPYNKASLEIVELGRSELLNGKVEMERSTPPRASDNLLSLNQLARCLKILKYGYGGRASRDRIDEANREINTIVDLGSSWADDFLSRSREEYEELMAIDLEEGFVASHRSDRIAYSATVLQLLAGCVYEWNLLQFPWNELADWLREADFDPKSEECIFLKSGMLIPGDTSLISRSQNMKATIAYIVNEALKANGKV